MDHSSFINYCVRNEQLGRPYKINGIRENVDAGEDPRYFGYKNHGLRYTTQGWEVFISLMGPTFAENPICVDEPTFIKTMQEQGMPNDEITRFIEEKDKEEDYKNY